MYGVMLQDDTDFIASFPEECKAMATAAMKYFREKVGKLIRDDERLRELLHCVRNYEVLEELDTGLGLVVEVDTAPLLADLSEEHKVYTVAMMKFCDELLDLFSQRLLHVKGYICRRMALHAEYRASMQRYRAERGLS